MNKLEIINAAIRLLGRDRITDLEDPDDISAERQVMADIYDVVYEGALARHLWTFAREETAQLSPDVTQTADGYDRYALPGGAPVLTRVYISAGAQDDTEWTYRIDGGYLVTPVDVPEGWGLYVGYLRKPTEGELPGYFVAALVRQLAADAAMPLTEIASTAAFWADQARDAWSMARSADTARGGQKSLGRWEEYSMVAGR